jgi:hypothetical protein
LVTDPKVIARIGELRRGGATKSGAAKILGLARGTIRKFWDQPDSDVTLPIVPIPATPSSTPDERTRQSPDPLQRKVRTRQAKLQLLRLERQRRHELRELQREEDEARGEVTDREALSKEVENLRSKLASESRRCAQFDAAERERRRRVELRRNARPTSTGFFHCVLCFAQHKLLQSRELKCIACGAPLVPGEHP